MGMVISLIIDDVPLALIDDTIQNKALWYYRFDDDGINSKYLVSAYGHSDQPYETVATFLVKNAQSNRNDIGPRKTKKHYYPPIPIRIWNDRLHHPNAECPECQKQIFFVQLSENESILLNELGPPWSEHGCAPSTELLPASNSLPNTKSTKPLWRANGWNLILSASLKESDVGYELSGYSYGKYVKLVLRSVSLETIKDIKQKKAIWHYRINRTNPHLDYIAGAYTDSGDFYELPASNLDRHL